MPFFQKKPVKVEARRVPSDADAEKDITAYLNEYIALADWCSGKSFMMGDESKNHILIPTLEGDMRASPGDWIIQGVQGEFYPCKPDIFEETYEAVSA